MALRDFYRTNLPLSSDPNVDTYIDVPLVSVNLVTNGVDAFTYTFDADFDVEFGDPAPTAEQVEMAMAGFTGEDDPEVAVFANFLAQTIYADIQPDRSIGGLVFVYPFQPPPVPTLFPTNKQTTMIAKTFALIFVVLLAMAQSVTGFSLMAVVTRRGKQLPNKVAPSQSLKDFNAQMMAIVAEERRDHYYPYVQQTSAFRDDDKKTA